MSERKKTKPELTTKSLLNEDKHDKREVIQYSNVGWIKVIFIDLII